MKQASIIFIYEGKAYGLYPGTLDASNEIFECISKEIKDDLMAFGAKDLFYSGILD